MSGDTNFTKPIKPVGIFWDIENCPVPREKSAFGIVRLIRQTFIVLDRGCREYEFMVACDVTKLRKEIQEDITKAGGVTLAHVPGSSKNAADEKLREAMKRFVDTHGQLSPMLVLISGDIDFVNDLRGYQTRQGCYIVVIHGSAVSTHFKNGGWKKTISFQKLCEGVTSSVGAGTLANGYGSNSNIAAVSSGHAPKGKNAEEIILMVSGLPGRMNFKILKDHLQEYANTVNGRVKFVKNGQGFICFWKEADAERATRLFLGVDISGNKLTVQQVKSIPFDNPNFKYRGDGTQQQRREAAPMTVATRNEPGLENRVHRSRDSNVRASASGPPRHGLSGRESTAFPYERYNRKRQKPHTQNCCTLQ